MLLTVDSSLVIAGIIEKEKFHDACKALITGIACGEHTSVLPYSVLVEVVGALKRRTGDNDLAERTRIDLQNIETILFLELTKKRANEAAAIARETGLAGMDAIVVQVARENGSTLVTLDGDMLQKSVEIVDALRIEYLPGRLKQNDSL